MYQDDRNIRIFISSTFRDMHAEREELVKYTFPELRKRCRERGVELMDVDLRWGVTDEQKAEGQVLPICLAEIERCRPYFIGLLGERYGWVPDEINPELIDDQPWLEEHREKSVTDLEIQHGVLEDPAMDGIAFFYFRDSEISKQVEAELAKERDYQSEPESTRSKLEHLKKRIKDSDVSLREDYPDAKTLGQWILEDLWAVIDRRFPEDQKPTALERTRMDHEAFAALRRKVYIGRPEYYQRLDEHVAGDSPPLILLGESGSGKSALLANWAEHYRTQHPDDFLLLHFIGGTADGADYVALLRRIMLEIQERYEPRAQGEADGVIREAFSNKTGSDEIPGDPQKVIEAFPLWLAKAAAKGRFILLLDALNQLEDRDNALDLGWLPIFFPANVRIILSLLPGRSLEAIRKREVETLLVKPIEEAESKQFIHDYLKQYRKKLNQVYATRIAAAPQSANPLYLRTLLEELRVFGKHEALEQRIAHYLEAETVDDLFERVLERLEQDYEQEPEHQGLVKKVMTLIWASRRGLSETEILVLIELPRAVWSPLYLALEESLVSRSGLLNFFHDYLRQAVEDRYLKNANAQTDAHLILADFFESKELDVRKIDELPWQLERIKDWERLRDVITKPAMFLSLTTEDRKYELIRYCMPLEKIFGIENISKVVLTKLKRSSVPQGNLPTMIDAIGRFFSLYGRYDIAEPLHRDSLVLRRQLFGGSHPDVAASLSNISELLRVMGRHEEAEPLCRQALYIRKASHGVRHLDVSESLNNLGLICFGQGRFAEAKTLYQQSLDIMELINGIENKNGAKLLNNLGLAHKYLGDHQEAEQLYRHAMKIWENLFGPDDPDIATYLNNLSGIYHAQDRYDEAVSLLERSLRIKKKAMPSDHLDIGYALYNIAVLYMFQGKYDEAEEPYQQALHIVKRSLGPDNHMVATVLHNMALNFHYQQKYSRAEDYYQRAISTLQKNMGAGHLSVAVYMSNLSELYKSQDRYKEAIILSQQALSILEKNSGPEDPKTLKILVNLAQMLISDNRQQDAEFIMKRLASVPAFVEEYSRLLNDEEK